MKMKTSDIARHWWVATSGGEWIMATHWWVARTWTC